MKTLLVLRHGKSSWKKIGVHDHDRPLKKRGKRDAPRIGQVLLEQGLQPDLIISSTAKRARQTAKRVAKSFDQKPEIVLSGLLYLAPPEHYIEVISNSARDQERVLIIGHNPGVEDLIEMLTGRLEFMPTAALAQIELPIEHWGDLSARGLGRLVNLWRPKDLPKG